MQNSKPVVLLEGHFTKRERAFRTREEKKTLSGSSLRERDDVKRNPVAHTEFVRVRKLFRAIEKDDALYYHSVNDYCLLFAECREIQAKIERVESDLEYLDNRKDEMDAEEYFRLRNSLYEKELKFSSALDRKRDKMRAIEDKNLMNITSAMRSIPKKPETKTNALQEALRGIG